MFLDKVSEYIEKNIKDDAFPGMSLLVARGERILIDEVFGYKSLIPNKTELQKSSIYDLASLTKPLITALLTILTVQRNELSLETEISEVFHDFPYSINIKQLLTHTSGLPAWYPLYLFQEPAYEQISSMKLEAKPGRKVNYSCVGYILITKVLEKIYKMTFTEIVQNEIIDKLILKNTFIGKVPENRLDEVVPTELGNKFEREMADKDLKFKILSEKFQWRNELIIGEPNDANAFYLNGNSGNAGLFSTPMDILKLSNEFYPDTTSLLKSENTNYFWKNLTCFKKSHRTAGFKLNSSVITSGGRSISRKAIGHNGFTGVSIWFEPETEYKFIVLTNRIHPEVKPLPFNKIRRKLHKFIKRNL